MPLVKLNDFSVFDLTGGVRLDKSHYQLADNEVARAFNFEFREKGRVQRRRGYQQVGNSAFTTNVDNFFSFRRINSATGAIVVRTYASSRAASELPIQILRSTRLTADVATSDVTITVASTTNFANSGVIEIEGDLINYTGTTATTFTGCTNIRVAHTAGHAVNQWRAPTLPGTCPTGETGIHQTVLQQSLIMGGRGTEVCVINNNDAETITDPAGSAFRLKSLAVYRDRTFGLPAGVNNTQGARVYFSARGDGTSYTTGTDFFDMNDDLGESHTAQKLLNDILWVFKTNSIFRYNETELQQTQRGIGAWNQKVVQEHKGIMYTFCPNGIFATTGADSQYIGEPVERYWKDFKPTYDAADFGIVTNTFATIFDEKYILYIGDISTEESVNDVVLVYDIRNKKWESWSGFTDITGLGVLPFYTYGDIGNAGQNFPSLWAGDATRTFRLFENRYIDTNGTLRGNDIFQDLVADSAGNAINASLDTKMYHFNLPQVKKKVGRLHVLAENPGFTVQYRTEKDRGVLSPFRSLGTTNSMHHIFELPADAEGYRMGLRVGFADPNFRGILNGFIFEDIYASI